MWNRFIKNYTKKLYITTTIVNIDRWNIWNLHVAKRYFLIMS